MEVHTYIEVSGTVKAILIGHHTEREGERRQERKETAQRNGGGEAKEKRKQKKEVWCATVWPTRGTAGGSDDGGRGEKKVPNRS